jgi:hypothetical protein
MHAAAAAAASPDFGLCIRRLQRPRRLEPEAFKGARGKAGEVLVRDAEEPGSGGAAGKELAELGFWK